MTTYCDREDAFIERSDGRARLFCCDGDTLWAFSDTMTDEQIFEALYFANKTFAAGIDRGRTEKTGELRRALGID